MDDTQNFFYFLYYFKYNLQSISEDFLAYSSYTVIIISSTLMLSVLAESMQLLCKYNSVFYICCMIEGFQFFKSTRKSCNFNI